MQAGGSGEVSIETFLITAFVVLFVLFCLSLWGLLWARRRDKRRKEAQAQGGGFQLGGGSRTQTPKPAPAPKRKPTRGLVASSGDGDLPDLDMLLAMTEPTGGSVAPSPVRAAPAPTGPRQPGIVMVHLSNGGEVEAAEMLILSRDRVSEKLIVQIGDYAYTGSEADISPEFRRQFVTLMKELSGVAPRLSKGVKVPKKQQEELEEDAADEPEPSTLAGQIEKRLQAKLRKTGAFQGREIHVHDARDGGVRIEVDDSYFDSVGAVSDPEVKAFIGQVVAEWQASQQQ